MGRRGPPPQSPAKKKIRGNTGKRKPSRRKPVAKKGQCPKWLDNEAKKKWKELERSARAVGPEVMAMAAQAWAEFKIATEMLRKEGRVVETATTTKAHPAVAQQRSAWKAWLDFRRLLAEADTGTIENDPLEQFL